jgi:hypothetical protein
VLVPGLVFGGLIGLAEHRRRNGGSRSRWLTLSPLVFLAALADPAIAEALVTSGFGSGALGVALFGLAGGCALSGRGRAWWRRTCGVLALLGVLLMTVMASDTEPVTTAHGAWIGVYAGSLLALLMIACAVPQRIGQRCFIVAGWLAAAVGALCGLAWAAALRGFMSEVAGTQANVDWAGTFLWVLLPGAVIGALLGWSEHRRWCGPIPHRRWLVWSPMLFAGVLLRDPRELAAGFEGGIGLAAVAVPGMCMVGGYALAGRGPRSLRVLCGVVALSAVPIWSITATDVGGPSFSLTDAHGAWAAVLYWSLLASFSLAAAIPHRAPARMHRDGGDAARSQPNPSSELDDVASEPAVGAGLPSPALKQAVRGAVRRPGSASRVVPSAATTAQRRWPA